MLFMFPLLILFQNYMWLFDLFQFIVSTHPSLSLHCRHGASAVEYAGSRMDGSSQQNSNSSRILCKTDMDHATLPNERRERYVGIEKERGMVKGNR